MALEFKLIEYLIVEAAKFRGQPTEGSDEPDLNDYDVNYEPEPGLLDKRERILGFRLYLGKGISHGQKVRDQLAAAISRILKITDSVGGIEGTPYQIASAQRVFRPWQNDISERHVSSGLVAR